MPPRSGVHMTRQGQLLTHAYVEILQVEWNAFRPFSVTEVLKVSIAHTIDHALVQEQLRDTGIHPIAFQSSCHGLLHW